MPKRTSKASSHFSTLFGARQGEQLSSGLKLIPLSKIQQQNQPRQTFPPHEISELAASLNELRQRGEGIEGTGFLQPILVTEHEDGYRIVAGERRFRASAEAGIELLPAVVVSMSSSNVLLAQLVENLQRRDLPPLEEARGMHLLMTKQHLSLRETARVLGKGKGYVENRINLLKMGADVQEMVSVQTDTLLHARDIDAIEDTKLRQELIHEVLQNGLSRADLRHLIHQKNPQVLAGKTKVAQPRNPQSKSAPSSANPDASKNSALSLCSIDQRVFGRLEAVIALLEEANLSFKNQHSPHRFNDVSLSMQVSKIEVQIQQLKKHLSIKL
jgi:ParB family chromosome partitioning protein